MVHHLYVVLKMSSNILSKKKAFKTMEHLSRIFFIFFYVNVRKYCLYKKFRFPIFFGFRRFEMFWTLFYQCLKNTHLSECMRQNFCDKRSSKIIERNFRNFILNCTVIQIYFYQFLMEILPQKASYDYLCIYSERNVSLIFIV